MSARGRESLLVPLLVPLLFATALGSLLFRTGAAPSGTRARPPLPTPVVLDRLSPPPQQPAMPSREPGVRGDGLRAW